MSLIKKADVKNHLSARHRSEIHLAQPATDSAHEVSTSEDPKVNGSVEDAQNVPDPSSPASAPSVTSKSVKA